jgi:P-loop containing NTP hydrolase pore-1
MRSGPPIISRDSLERKRSTNPKRQRRREARRYADPKAIACNRPGAASQQGRAGLRLQHALPNARVVYVSATGATTVHNLGYS